MSLINDIIYSYVGSYKEIPTFEVNYNSMKFYRGLLFILSLILFLLNPLYSQDKDSIPGDFCITSEELKLHGLINEYRKAMMLPEISLSKSLSYVAKMHAKDLHTNKPDTNTCNFHSWSDKGNWVACCFEKNIKDKSCMLNKPQEFTSYTGFAYEIVYWENKNANADKAFDQWRETSASRSLMTNFKEWENYTWNALGVGIYKGFAIVWFGEQEDPETETIVCETRQVIKSTPAAQEKEKEVISSPTERFYIIYGSFGTLEDAKSQLAQYRESGFKKAKVVTKDNKFRISLADYATSEQAAAAKKELPAKYKDAWVLPY